MDLRIALVAATAAAICGDPAQPCAGFREHDLSFARSPAPLARDEERSQPFFAVIVVSGARCAIPESERRRIQALFPSRKVFSSRFECDGDVENNVKYTNAAEDRAFVAVHGGATRAEADKALAEARAKGFRDANVRRMQAVLVHP
jgi:hypothetical protein